MEGVFAAAHYRHVSAAVEKGITGGTVADAVALKTRQPRDAGHGPGCTGGEDDSIRRVISVERLYREFIGIGQAHGFGGDELDAHRLGPLDALPLQLGTGDGGGEAVVILDLLGAVERTRPPGEDGGVHPGAGGVQRSRHSRRAGTNDDDVGHSGPPYTSCIIKSMHFRYLLERDACCSRAKLSLSGITRW